MKKEILIVSHGGMETKQKTSRQLLQERIRTDYPEYLVASACANERICRRLQALGNEVSSIPEAMERADRNGVRQITVLFTHILCGEEYEKARAQVMSCRGKGVALTMTTPLLHDMGDIERFAEALAGLCPVQAKEAVCFMGHGSRTMADTCYASIQDAWKRSRKSWCFLTTFSKQHTFEALLEELRAHEYEKIFLLPLLFGCGRHAEWDMAGDWEGSLKYRLEREGYLVEPILSGLGCYEQIQRLYLLHLKEVIGCGLTTDRRKDKGRIEHGIDDVRH